MSGKKSSAWFINHQIRYWYQAKPNFISVILEDHTFFFGLFFFILNWQDIKGNEFKNVALSLKQMKRQLINETLIMITLLAKVKNRIPLHEKEVEHQTKPTSANWGFRAIR